MTDSNLLTIVKSTTTATSAGVNPTEWAASHVFVNQRHFIKGINRGRLPVAIIYEEQDSIIDWNATSSGSSSGLETHVYTVEVITSRGNEESPNNIIKAIVTQIKNNTSWELFGSDVVITSAESDPWGYSKKLQLTVRTEV